MVPRALLSLLLPACASHHAVFGLVLDQHGVPVPRATIAAAPGDVRVHTDQAGRFTLDHLLDPATGQPTRLIPRQTYTLEVFKPGFHLLTVEVPFTRGALHLPDVRLVDDALPVPTDGLRLELSLRPHPTHDAGATYEGQ